MSLSPSTPAIGTTPRSLHGWASDHAPAARPELSPEAKARCLDRNAAGLIASADRLEAEAVENIGKAYIRAQQGHYGMVQDLARQADARFSVASGYRKQAANMQDEAAELRAALASEAA